MTHQNTLYYGDNLDILRRYIADETMDLIYLDPPFNSKATYNILFAEKNGSESAAQIKAFEDTWHWDRAAEDTYLEIVETAPKKVADLVKSLRSFLGRNDVMAYLVMMGIRLVELHRVLKTNGSIYLHCDPTASHYLKLLMDSIFDVKNFRNEIIWRRTGAHGPQRRFGPIHDVILFYTKSDEYFFRVVKRPYMSGHVERRYTKDKTGRYKFTSGGNVLTGPGATSGESGAIWRGFNPSAKNRHWAIPGFLVKRMPPEFKSLSFLEKLETLYKKGLIEIKEGTAWPTPVRYLEKEDGHPLQDIWAHQPYTEGTVFGTKQGIDQDVAWMGPTDPERLGYQTQKPLGLLERIIRSSCPDNGWVCDPFCGCGTTVIVAEKLKRKWIGIDITYLAISLMKNRLKDTFGDVKYDVKGEPADLKGAEALKEQDPYQFQWWALGLVGARPAESEKKRGADRGIDGYIYFHDDPKKTETKQIIIQVKSGHVNPAHIRDLKGVVGREKAQIGVFITLEEPTRHMKKEAVSAGYYRSPLGHDHPKIQILTIEKLLNGSKIDYPSGTRGIDATFRKAKRYKKKKEQIEMKY